MSETASVSEAVATQTNADSSIILPKSETNRQLVEAARAENAQTAANKQGVDTDQSQIQEDPTLTTPDATVDAKPQITTESVGESLIGIVKNTISRGIDDMEKSLPSDAKEKAAELAKPENAAKRSLHAVDFLYDVPANMGGLSELPFDPKDKPVQTQHNGQLVTLVSIKGISDADIFVLQAKDTSGNLLPNTIKLPRQAVIDAQIVAEKDGLGEATPDAQKGVVATGIDVLANRVLGNEHPDPLEELSSEQLKAKQEEVDAVDKSLSEPENASRDSIERPDPIEKWTDENVRDQLAVFRHEFDVKHDKKGEKQLQQELNDALKEVAVKANKQVKDLTPEEVNIAERVVVRSRIDKAIDAHAGNLPTQHRALIEQQINNHIEAYGKYPSEQQIAQMKRNLAKEYVTAIKLEKVMDPKYMEQIRRKFGWKDLAGLILFLTKDLGTPFAADMTQRR